MCCGDTTEGKLPLTIYQHGHLSGGALEFLYTKIMNKIASNGFCIVAPESCPSNDFCQNGETSYLEVLKTLVYMEQNKTNFN